MARQHATLLFMVAGVGLSRNPAAVAVAAISHEPATSQQQQLGPSAGTGLAFPLPPAVVAVSPEPAGSGHAWFPQFFQRFTGSKSSTLLGAVQADDDGCPNRTGCSALSAGHCYQPCVPAGQAYAAVAPGPGEQPTWHPLASSSPVAALRTSCAPPNRTAVGRTEAVCAGWRWSPALEHHSNLSKINRSSFVSTTGQHFSLDQGGAVLRQDNGVEMSMSGWPDGVAAVGTTLSNLLALPSGALFQSVYFVPPTTQQPKGTHYSLAGVISTDGAGRRWQFVSVIAAGNAAGVYERAWVGPGESSSVLTGAGRVRVVFRVNSRGPNAWTQFRTTISAGHDEHGLKRWTAIRPLVTPGMVTSARPVLQGVRLPGGSSRLLLAGGRPSLHLFLSADTEGEEWLPGVNIARVHNSHYGNDSRFSFCEPLLDDVQGCFDPRSPFQPPDASRLAGTTGYTSLVPLSDDRFLLTYDKLGNSWYGPLPSGPRNGTRDIDAVFALVVHVSPPSARGRRAAAKADDAEAAAAITGSPPRQLHGGVACAKNSTRSCEERNGTGTAACSNDGTWDTCNISSCDAGWRFQDSACVSAACGNGIWAQHCNAGNGSGFQKCDPVGGAPVGACYLTHCTVGFELSDGGCYKLAIHANPRFVAAGGNSTLSWDVPGATACRVNGNGAALWSGTEAVKLLQSPSTLQDVAYTLSCDMTDGTHQTGHVTVHVPVHTPASDFSFATIRGANVMDQSNTSDIAWFSNMKNLAPTASRMHLNFMRMNMDLSQVAGRRTSGAGGQPEDDFMHTLAESLDALSRHAIKCILVFDVEPSSASRCPNNASFLFVRSLAQKIAATFGGHPAVHSFEMLNEAYSTMGDGLKCPHSGIRDYVVGMYNLVRTLAPSIPTTVSEAWFWWYIPAWHDVSSFASFHIYPCGALCKASPVNATQMSQAQALLAENIVAARKAILPLPLMMGEFGVFNLTPADQAWFYHSMYDVLRAHNMGSLFWDLSVSDTTYGVLYRNYTLKPAAVAIAEELSNRSAAGGGRDEGWRVERGQPLQRGDRRPHLA